MLACDSRSVPADARPGATRRHAVIGKASVASLLGFAAFLVACPAPAQDQREVWSVLPMAAEGMDPAVALTFRDLLQGELVAETQRAFVPAPHPCSDNACARAASAQLGANRIVYGMLRPLGSKTLALLTLVDGPTGQTLSHQSMSVDRVEDLDAVARRMAKSLVHDTPPSATAEIGTVTHQEEQPEARRGVASNFMFRLGGIVPLSDDGYAGLGTGLAADMGMWIEATHFALEPRVGVRFDVAKDTSGTYFELPVDLGAYYVFGLGDVAPLLGGGLGMHYLMETRHKQISLGSSIVSEHDGRLEDGGWGLAGFLRGGLLLGRTYKARLAVTADYNATFVELNGGNVAQSLVFGIGAVL